MADDCVRGMDGLKLENLAITVEIARRSELDLLWGARNTPNATPCCSASVRSVRKVAHTAASAVTANVYRCRLE